jgi:hypothetical protein
VVAGLLAPDGFVYLVEGHPFAQILDDASGRVVTRDYFEREPIVDDYPFSYTDGPALEHTREVEFQHGLGEIITALADAGLRIEFVHEWDSRCSAGSRCCSGRTTGSTGFRPASRGCRCCTRCARRRPARPDAGPS